MSRPSVLVTGAAGYVGSLTLEALAGRRDEMAGLVAVDVAEVPGGRVVAVSDSSSGRQTMATVV